MNTYFFQFLVVINLSFFTMMLLLLFNHSVVSDSLQPHGLPHPRLPWGCPTPGFPVHHQFLELAQTHVHRVSDAIHLSHPLWPPSPPALSISQHQGLFQWVGSLHQVAEVLELPLQHQFFPVAVHGWFSWLVWSSSCPRKSQVVSKYQSFGAQPSLWSNSHISTWLLEKP